MQVRGADGARGKKKCPRLADGVVCESCRSVLAPANRTGQNSKKKNTSASARVGKQTKKGGACAGRPPNAHARVCVTHAATRIAPSPPARAHPHPLLYKRPAGPLLNTVSRFPMAAPSTARPPYLARPRPAPAGGVEAEVEEMFETLTIAQIREVRAAALGALWLQSTAHSIGRARLFFFLFFLHSSSASSNPCTTSSGRDQDGGRGRRCSSPAARPGRRLVQVCWV